MPPPYVALRHRRNLRNPRVAMLCHQRVDDAWRALWPLDVTHARAKLSPMMPSKSKVDTSREQESTLREKRKNAAESAFTLYEKARRKYATDSQCYRMFNLRYLEIGNFDDFKQF